MKDNQCKSCGIRYGYHINNCPALQVVAYLVEGFDHSGNLYAKILHFTVEEARDSASEFARHYFTVTTTPLTRATDVVSSEK